MPRKSFKHDAPRIDDDESENEEEKIIIDDVKTESESSDTEVYVKKGKKKKNKPVDAQKLFNDVVELIQEFKNDEKIQRYLQNFDRIEEKILVIEEKDKVKPRRVHS
jgi:hypothetical protein